MNNHFIALFEASHFKKTVILMSSAFLLIIISLSWGITDNLPAITMLLVGIIIFFFSFIHPWKKTSYFATLIAACGTILPLVWGSQTLGEFIDYFVGGICVAGILTGTLGIFIRLINNTGKNPGQ